MFNSGFRGKRANDNQGIISQPSKFVQIKNPQPYISGYAISGTDDTALDPAGGQTVLVNGTGFVAGISATLGGTQIASVTLVSPTQISFTSPANAGGSYSLVVYNSSGGAAILVPGLTYSSVPTYTTNAGSIGSYYETTAISTQVVATSDSSLTYTLASGSLPSGATLNSNGTITGTSPVDSSSTTYTFAITATDAELQDVTRTFTLTINTDVVTWVSPAGGQTYTLLGNQAMNNVTLSATSAAGSSVTYTANALPTGLTLSSGVVSGTPTVAGNTSTLFTATATTTTRTATRTVNWTVTLGDTLWQTVSLLVNGSTPTTTFINDASLNNSQLTIAGDTKSNNFNPYLGVYYGVSHSATPDYLSVPHNSNFSLTSGQTDTFIIEGWFYFNVVTAQTSLFDKSGVNAVSFANWTIYLNASSQIQLQWGVSGTPGTSTVGLVGSTFVPVAGTWYHIAFVKSSADWAVFANGTRIISYNGLNTAGDANPSALRIGFGIQSAANAAYFNGYISNVRAWRGTSGAPYSATSSTLTVPTSPLTAIAGTTLLSHQSARFVDNSLANATLTATGANTKSVAISPFTIPTTVPYNTQYSVYFDGTGDTLTIPSSAATNISSGDFTVEMWFRTSVVTGDISQYLVDSYFNGVNRFMIYSFNNTMYAQWISAGAGKFISTTIAANTWYHLAFVKNGDVYTLYLNGTSVGTPITDANALATGDTIVTIGRSPTAGGPLFGYISNLRFVKGTAVYTSNFTPPTSPLTAISGTSVLTCQDSTIKDNSSNALAITSTADARPIAVSPFTMTTSNTTVTSLGSAYVDGTGDYLTASANPAFAFGATNDFTAECWVYFTTLNADQSPGIISVANSGTSTGWQIYADSNNGWGVRSNVANVFAVSNPPKAYQWYHVAYVRKSGVHALYVNGVVNATSSSSYTWSDQVFYTGYTPIGQTVYGYIADVRLVNGTALYTANFLPPQAPLTPVTNTKLLTCQYNGGATNNGIIDQSGWNNNLTRFGTVSQGTFSPYSQTGWSLCTTERSFLSIPTNSNYDLISTDFTIEFWFNPISLNTMASSASNLFGNGLSTGNSGWALSWDGSGSTVTSIVYQAYNAGWQTNVFTVSIPFGTWAHVALVRNGSGASNLSLYVNGVLQGTAQNQKTYSAAGGTFTLGSGAYTQNATYSGNAGLYLSNVRIVKSVVYSAPFTPPSAPLTAIQNTVLLVCQSNSNQDNSYISGVVTSSTHSSTYATVQAYSPFSGLISVPTSYSNYFDGTGDYLSVPFSSSFAFSGNFTVEGWIYINALPTTGSQKYIIASWDAGSNKRSFYFILQESSGYKLVVGLSSDGTSANAASVMASWTTPVINTWYHVAFVRSSNTITVYVNGTSIGTGTLSISSYNLGSAVSIGADAPGLTAAFYWNGYISNLRVVNGTALYTGSFTPSTTPLTTTSQGATASQVSLLTCQSSTMIDNGINNLTLTANGDVKPKPFNPFGTTNTTNVSYDPTVNSGSIYMDGTGDYLTAPNTYSFDLSRGKWTIECWFYQLAPKQVQLFSISAALWRLAVAADGSAGFTFNTSSTASYPAGSFPPGQWNHISASFINDGTNSAQRSHANGKLVATGQLVPNADTSSLFYVGNNKDAAGAWDFNGYITDIRITKGECLYYSSFVPSFTALPKTQNTAFLLNGVNGGIIDYHSSNDLITAGNTQLISEDPYAGSYYSVKYNGTTDYQSLLLTTAYTSMNFGTGDFTVEFWMNNVTTPASETWIMNAGPNQSGGVSRGWGIATYTSAAAGLWFTYTNNGAVTNNFGALPSLGAWHHIAFVKTTNTMKCYVNGAQYGSTWNLTYNSIDATVATDYFGIGGKDNSNNGLPGRYWYNGYISNFRVVKGVAVYTGAFTVPTAPLAATQSSSTNIAEITGTSTSLLINQKNISSTDSSASAYTLTAGGAVKSLNPFQNNTGKSLYFDGTGDYILVPNSSNLNPGAGSFTIEFWLYYNTITGYQSPLTKGYTGANELLFQTGNGNGTLIIYINGTAVITESSAARPGQWYYYALVRNGTALTFYRNGVSVGTATNSIDITNTSPLGVGATGKAPGGGAIGDYPINGYIKDLRITKGIARTITVPTTPFETK